MNKLITLTLLSVCSMSVFATSANQDSIITQQKNIESITVTARKISRDITSGKPLQSVEKDKIEILGLDNLADAVKRFAGTNIKDYGGIGGIKTVSIRNLGSHHTAISYDGITVSNTQAGQTDIGRYSLDNVQSVSLAIGENGNMMQTARHSASAGVLYIKTERPHFDFGHDYSFRFRIKGGSFGLVNPNFRYWQKLRKATTLSVNADYMRADGLYPFILKNGRNNTKEKRYNSDIYTLRGETNIYHKLNGGELNLKTYWFYSERGLPGSVVFYNNNAKERLWDEDFFTQANIKKQINNRWHIATSLKYTHTWNKYIDIDVKYPDGRDIDINRQNEYYASGTVCWKPFYGMAVALAQDIIFNNLHSVGKSTAQPERYSSLTALTAKYLNNRVEAYAGITGTFITEDVKTGNVPEDRKRLSPTLSVSYRLLPAEALYVRAMYKSTFRVPSFNDLYYNRIGNVNLSPEKADEYNIGITWQSRPLGAINGITASLDGYFNSIKDKIVAFPTMYVWKMANFGKVKMYGLNATLATDVSLSHNIKVELTAAYSLQNCIDVTDRNTLYYKTQIPYTPKNTGNGSILLYSPWINIGYSITGCDKRYSLQQKDREYRLDGYIEHDISLSHEFRLKTYRLNIQATLNNLTDEQYEIIKYYPMPGISWSAAATLTF